jgi:hypothetical protein
LKVWRIYADEIMPDGKYPLIRKNLQNGCTKDLMDDYGVPGAFGYFQIMLAAPEENETDR